LARAAFRDQATVDYFDELTPEYHPDRMQDALEAVRRYGNAESSLVEIGCGTGNILELIRAETAVRSLCGIDVSERSLERTRERLSCPTYQGSIADPAFVHGIGERFEFALLGAVLHHLIGRSRRGSSKLAATAIVNSLSILKDRGYLLIVEPVFYPKLAMDAVFYLKKLVTKATNRRVSILGYWNNVGAPVVSYYRTEDLIRMIELTRGTRLIECRRRDQRPSLLLRLAMITRRKDVTLVVQKLSS
jgi:SAM-dependent methyltransferase